MDGWSGTSAKLGTCLVYGQLGLAGHLFSNHQSGCLETLMLSHGACLATLQLGWHVVSWHRRPWSGIGLSELVICLEYWTWPPGPLSKQTLLGLHLCGPGGQGLQDQNMVFAVSMGTSVSRSLESSVYPCWTSVAVAPVTSVLSTYVH